MAKDTSEKDDVLAVLNYLHRGGSEEDKAAADAALARLNGEVDAPGEEEE